MLFRFLQALRSRQAAFWMMILWMGVIFSFSMLSGKETAGPPPLWYFLERKGAHVFEYAVLMILTFRYFFLSYTRESWAKILLLAAAFSLMYAATDELHQFFVPLRGARFSDVLIDGAGILLGSAALFFLMRNENRPR